MPYRMCRGYVIFPKNFDFYTYQFAKFWLYGENARHVAWPNNNNNIEERVQRPEITCRIMELEVYVCAEKIIVP